MAKTAAQLAAEAYEKQKRQNRYGTTGGYTVSKPNPVDKSQQAAQSYQQQKNSGIYKTISGGTVRGTSKSGGTSGGSRTIPSVTMPAIKTPTIPTKKYNPVRPTPNRDVSSVDQSQIAANAYKRQLAKYRNSNDEEETTKKNPDMGIGYSGPTAMGTFTSLLTPKSTAQTGQNSSDTYGPALDPNYEYKTYAQQKAEAEEARKEQERAYQQWLAQQQTVEQPVMEEVVEEELDPMEDYWQAIIDAQNAQYAAMNQALRNQQVGLNGLYDQNAADLYAQYVRSGLVLPEQMAGMATGAADSMLLQNDLNYQNNLNKNELERIAGLADLESQMAQNQAEADLQAAETAAEWAKMAYQQRLANQNKSSSKDDGYTVSEILKMQNQGLIDAATAQQMLGLAGGVKKVTAQDYINSNYGRTDFANMTADNIRADLKYLLDTGAMDLAEYNTAMKHYKLA